MSHQLMAIETGLVQMRGLGHCVHRSHHPSPKRDLFPWKAAAWLSADQKNVTPAHTSSAIRARGEVHNSCNQIMADGHKSRAARARARRHLTAPLAFSLHPRAAFSSPHTLCASRRSRPEHPCQAVDSNQHHHRTTARHQSLQCCKPDIEMRNRILSNGT